MERIGFSIKVKLYIGLVIIIVYFIFKFKSRNSFKLFFSSFLYRGYTYSNEVQKIYIFN